MVAEERALTESIMLVYDNLYRSLALRGQCIVSGYTFETGHLCGRKHESIVNTEYSCR